jgi:hypothetical protein
MTISVGLALILVVVFAAAFGLVAAFAPAGIIRKILFGVLGFLGFVVLLWAVGLLSGAAVRVR